MASLVPPALYTNGKEKTKDKEGRHKTFTTCLSKVGQSATGAAAASETPPFKKVAHRYW